MMQDPKALATPQQYASALTLFHDGRAVLDDLVRLFAGPPFVMGSPDATAYNCGTKAVIEHMHAMIQRGS